MGTVYNLLKEAARELNEQYLASEKNNEDPVLQRMKDEFKTSAIEHTSLSFRFTTKECPQPVRISFIQRRAKEILGMFIADKIVFNDIMIAIEETITNIIEHSYADKRDDVHISFQFTLFFNKIIIKIEDYGEQGKSFDFDKAGHYHSLNELKKKVKETKGGMGVYLIKRVMDEVVYEVMPGRYNRITMSKSLKVPDDIITG